ncbi:phosphotransferase, partial [Cohnella yongneupensis]
MIIKDILLHKFQNIRLIELTGGYTNSTFLLEGTSPPAVAKISDKEIVDGTTEINSLKLLNETSITPRVHDFFESNGYLFTIMDYIPGVNSQTYLDDNDISKTQEIYELLGKHLAKDIHSIKLKNSKSNLPTIKLINIDLDSLDFIPRDPLDEVKSILDIGIEEEYVLIHG